MPHNSNESVSDNRTSKREAIGAFCLDICDSTERIEKFEEKALKHHKSFLESAGRYFLKTLPKASRHRYASGDLWVPGDALWGVFYKESGYPHYDSVAISLWRVLISTAYGLSLCNSNMPNGLDPLSIRGVFLAGSVLRETVLGKLRLYNGRALNACGRLEKSVDANTVIAGFVVPDNFTSARPLFESIAGSPTIDSLGLKQKLRTSPDAPGLGYDIGAEVVSDNDQKLLRFTGWRGRGDLRGLGQCRILTTNFKFLPKKERSIDVTYNYEGRWVREERNITLTGAESHWDLIELLDVARCESFDFLKSIYEIGDILFVIYPEQNTFRLECHRKTDRPRILREERKTRLVDFTQHSYCILPTFTHASSGGAKLLIQAQTRDGNKLLCFSKTSNEVLKSYENYSDYLDSASPSIEFVFRKA